jgi:hypothetical protein
MRWFAVVCCASMVLAFSAAPAVATFSGRDGLLAVQPVSGPGIVLVNARGGSERRICAGEAACAELGEPRWSPDGRVLAVTARRPSSLIYADGSCLDCWSIPGRRPAFTRDPALVTAVSGGSLVEYGSDGISQATLVSGGVSNAVWSSRGELAIVRAGKVWVGSPGSLRAIANGTAPSWSPAGSELAIVSGGWVTVVGVDRRFARRLVPGTAPTWSPDGRSIAFVATRHALSVVPVGGGAVHRIGNVRGVAVDWQPIPSGQVAGCIAPPGSTTVASSPLAVVTKRSFPVSNDDFNGTGSTYMGCLRSTGREHVLQRLKIEDEDDTNSVSDVTVGGPYAALVDFYDDPHYGGSGYTVDVFDLSTGVIAPTLGGEQVSCADYSGGGCGPDLDGLVVGANGFTAAHTTVDVAGYADGVGSEQVFNQTEQIVAADSTGVHVLDTATTQFSIDTPGGLSVLTGLALNGDTVTWEHAGVPESAVLG